MPRARPTIASFWVYRPEEHPEADSRNYPGMLRVLQRSCDRLGLRHVVLTDHRTRRSPLWPDGLDGFVCDLPGPLMQACVEVQAQWLEQNECDTLIVGADCIFVGDPVRFYPRDPGMCVTYRNKDARYPINSIIMVRRHSLDRVRPIFRWMANRCGTKWCDDQRAIREALDPMPEAHGTYERQGVAVAFLPMARFNVVPKSVDDACRGACMLHFRGKGRKQFFFDWAARHMPEAA